MNERILVVDDEKAIADLVGISPVSYTHLSREPRCHRYRHGKSPDVLGSREVL